MSIDNILILVTIIVTYGLGLISKKSAFINTNLIPIQNIVIGVIVAFINWLITKDFNTAIAVSGLLAGGIYDIFHNLEKIIKK